MLPQLEPVNRPPRERAALENLVLRLVIVVGDLVLLERFLERDDVRVLLLDQDLHLRFVDRRRREGVDRHAEEHDEEGGDRRPAPLVEHLHVIEQVHLAVADHVAAVAVRRAAAVRRGGRYRRRRAGVDAVEAWRHLEAAGSGRAGIGRKLFRHQKNLSATMTVSPDSTRSVSFTLTSRFSPLTMRTILMRLVVPRSVTPPASDSACSTVVFLCCIA